MPYPIPDSKIRSPKEYWDAVERIQRLVEDIAYQLQMGYTLQARDEAHRIFEITEEAHKHMNGVNPPPFRKY